MIAPAIAPSAEAIAAHATTAPRYTSYPPATAFGPVPPALASDELARMARARDRVSLYIHVPFCRSLCAYCGCNVTVTRALHRGDAYVDTLATEMVRVAAALGDAPVTEIALGGGSPNFLTPTALTALATALDRYFTIAPDARRSIELDPRATTSEQIELLAKFGWRSMSVGVQDFDPNVQELIGRHQSVAQTAALVSAARSAGITDVNVDLIYGLPRQTEASLAATIDHVIDLAPDRIALFGYAHVPDLRPQQRLLEKRGRLPDLYERATLLVAASERLRAAGYQSLGIDHFARPGSALARAAESGALTRNFQGYTERLADAVVGLGPSAISSTPRAHWQNHSDLDAWAAALAAGELPVARGIALTLDDQIRGDAITELMCTGELDLAALGQRWSIDAPAYFADELAGLAEDRDLVHYDPPGQRLATSPLGQVLVRNVCMRFDRHLPKGRRGSTTI